VLGIHSFGCLATLLVRFYRDGSVADYSVVVILCGGGSVADYSVVAQTRTGEKFIQISNTQMPKVSWLVPFHPGVEIPWLNPWQWIIVVPGALSIRVPRAQLQIGPFRADLERV
jgi:hypothetical protein